MHLSRLHALAALAAPLLVACAASQTTVPTGDPADPDTSSPETPKTPETPETPKTPETPEAVVFEYSTVELPAENLSVASIGGSSASDVWVVATASAATDQDPWSAYHYDGSKWTETVLTAQKGRPNFGVAAVGSSVFFGFSYSGEVFELTGATLKKAATFSVTSGYSMAAVGSSIFVGTQENFTAGPLYEISKGAAKQVGGVSKNLGGVHAIWGASEADVWLARSETLGRLVNGTYQDADPTGASDVNGTASDDVWAVGPSGVRHFDGATWSDVPFPETGPTQFHKPGSVVALSKDEVLVTTRMGDVYRYDGTTFAKEERPSAPERAATIGKIGKDEAWIVGAATIARLAPEK
jgi:hypothetical protein